MYFRTFLPLEVAKVYTFIVGTTLIGKTFAQTMIAGTLQQGHDEVTSSSCMHVDNDHQMLWSLQYAHLFSFACM